MLVIPAVDLKGGRCVRLLRGRPETEEVFSDDPAEMAARWERLGAPAVHVVDLDGAFEGVPQNLPSLKAILERIKVPVQFGGGVRDPETAGALLAMGVSRVVLGTRALEDPAFLRGVLDAHTGRVMVSLDIRDGFVAVRGWAGILQTPLEEVASRLRQAGLRRVIVTDVGRDGTLSGPNPELARRVASTGLEVVVAGGISSVRDIVALKGLPGVVGAIVGRALYSGGVSLPEAIAAAAGPVPAAGGPTAGPRRPAGGREGP